MYDCTFFFRLSFEADFSPVDPNEDDEEGEARDDVDETGTGEGLAECPRSDDDVQLGMGAPTMWAESFTGEVSSLVEAESAAGNFSQGSGSLSLLSSSSEYV